MRYLNPAARESFRQQFPEDSPVVPVDLLTQAHYMLQALDAADLQRQSLDREIVKMLRQAVESPRLVVRTHDGLHTLFYGALHLRGVLHGDSGLWRAAARRCPELPSSSAVRLEDYAKLLWAWVEAFDAVLVERPRM